MTNTIEDLNMKLNISHRIDPNPDYFTATLILHLHNHHVFFLFL